MTRKQGKKSNHAKKKDGFWISVNEFSSISSLFFTRGSLLVKIFTLLNISLHSPIKSLINQQISWNNVTPRNEDQTTMGILNESVRS